MSLQLGRFIKKSHNHVIVSVIRMRQKWKFFWRELFNLIGFMSKWALKENHKICALNFALTDAIVLAYGSSSKTCYFVQSIFPLNKKIMSCMCIWLKVFFLLLFFLFILLFVQSMVMKCYVMSCHVVMNSLCIFMRAFVHRSTKCRLIEQRQGNRFHYYFHSTLLISRTKALHIKYKTGKVAFQMLLFVGAIFFFLVIFFRLLIFVVIYLSIHFSFTLFLEWNKCWSAPTYSDKMREKKNKNTSTRRENSESLSKVSLKCSDDDISKSARALSVETGKWGHEKLILMSF